MFSFLESFFFIVLGFSFIFILLMVHHFKKRLDVMEKNTETLGDICKTIVGEIDAMKRIPDMHAAYSDQSTIPTTNLRPEDLIHMMNEPQSSYMNMFIGGSSMHPVFSGMNIDHTQVETLNNVEIISSDDDDQHTQSSDDPDIKLEEMQIDDNDETETSSFVLKEENLIDTIYVRKLDETESLEVLETESSVVTGQNENDFEEEPITRKSLQKMTVQMLRSFVIREGYCTDPSKLKKLELIHMIMSQREMDL